MAKMGLHGKAQGLLLQSPFPNYAVTLTVLVWEL